MCSSKSVSERTPARTNFSAMSGVILRALEKVWVGAVGLDFGMGVFYRNHFARGDLQTEVIASDVLSAKQSIPPSIE
jgi:hypothetical protein